VVLIGSGRGAAAVLDGLSEDHRVAGAVVVDLADADIGVRGVRDKAKVLMV
jgi:hypothetical protein